MLADHLTSECLPRQWLHLQSETEVRCAGAAFCVAVDACYRPQVGSLCMRQCQLISMAGARPRLVVAQGMVSARSSLGLAHRTSPAWQPLGSFLEQWLSVCGHIGGQVSPPLLVR